MAPNLSEDLLVRREAIRLVLRVDALAVERDVEHTAVSALKARGDSELLLDGGLQTGGLGVVVSFGAVGDLDVHRYLLSIRMIPESVMSEEGPWAGSA